MEDGVPDTEESVVAAEGREQGKCAEELDEEGAAQDEAREPDDAADLRSRDGVLHGAALHERDFMTGQKSEGGGDRDDAESADLDQHEDDRLAEARPVGAGVLHDEAGYAHRRGRREQRLVERRPEAARRRNRQHQEQRTHEDDAGEAPGDNLKRRKTMHPPKLFFSHRNSPFLRIAPMITGRS